MECMNCGWDSKDWKDITKDCKVEMTLTKPDEDLGYVLLKYKDVTIGSFDGEKFSYHNQNPSPDVFTAPQYKGMYYTDGGVLENFPIFYLNNVPVEEILSIKISQPHDYLSKIFINPNLTTFEHYCVHLVETVLLEIERLKLLTLPPELLSSTLYITSNKRGLKSFLLGKSERKKLFKRGYKNAKVFSKSTDFILFRLKQLPLNIRQNIQKFF